MRESKFKKKKREKRNYYALANTNLLPIILQVKVNHVWPHLGLFGLGISWGHRVTFLTGSPTR